jgi:Alpha amylase, catalytic domain
VREPLRIAATRHPRLIEIDARAWMARLTARAGRRVGLGDVRAREIEPIADLGFDLVWLTATWQNGAASRRLWRGESSMRDLRAELLPDGSDNDIVGSPYAISAYEPSDSLGGAVGLAALRTRLSEAGIGLILDFVPNHTAVDHPWVRRHPEWYVHADTAQRSADPTEYFEVRSDGRHWIAHGRDPNYPPWTDTAQLEYRHPDVPRAMTQALREVATRCDGVMCSMAMLVLDDVFRGTWGSRSVLPSVVEDASPFGEFWWHASSSVREAYPRFLLIGEAYWGLEWRLQQLGFDFTYDRPLLERQLAGDAGAVAAHLRADDVYQRRSVRMLEDRNGPRIAARMSPQQERATALLDATIPGMFMVRDGQMDGAQADVPVQLRREPDEPLDDGLHEFYARLMLATNDETFRLGQAIRMEPVQAWGENMTHEGIVARLWVGQHRQLRLAVANLTPEPAQGYIPLPLPEFAGKVVQLRDLLDDEATYIRQGDDLLTRGLYLDLPGYGGHIFRITREASPARRRSGSR